MVHDGNSVPGHAKVELENVHAELDGALERRNRVLGKQSPGAAMSLDFHGVCSHRVESEKQRVDCWPLRRSMFQHRLPALRVTVSFT